MASPLATGAAVAAAVAVGGVVAIVIGSRLVDQRRDDEARAARQAAAEAAERELTLLRDGCRREIAAALGADLDVVPPPSIERTLAGDPVACLTIDRFAVYRLPNVVQQGWISCQIVAGKPALLGHRSESAWRTHCPTTCGRIGIAC